MIGRTINHYRIIEKLGSGGMGEVYLADDLKLERKVAVKFLPEHLTKDAKAVERFEREAKAIAALNHPNIVIVYDIIEEDDNALIVMEYVEGDSLRDIIYEHQLESAKIIDIMIQTANGLKKAHETGIVHRDIKPENIIVEKDGTVKILDFGLAKLKGVRKLTRDTSTLGTVHYMSPEQLQGNEVDYRSDIWSLGVMFYELLTGRIPFSADYDSAVMYSILHEEAEPVQKLQPDLSSEIVHIVNRALEKNADNRYQSMQDMLIDLQRLKRDSEELTAAPAEEATIRKTEEFTRRKWPRSVSIAFGTIFLLILIFLSVTYLPSIFRETRSFEPEPIAVLPFENLTGDDVYNIYRKSIANLLIAKLEQSPYLHVTTWERMGDLLKQTGKENLDIVDISKETAFDLCRMDGVGAAVTGSYSKIGTMFAIEVKVLNVTSKQIRISATSSGDGDNSVFGQIDQLSEAISRGIGLSEWHIREKQRPIAEVTTTSIEAYNYFIRGREESEKLYFNESRKFLEKALEIDSTFALAYLYLGYTYSRLGYSTESNTAYEQAKLFAKHATGKDSLFIEAVIAPTRGDAIDILKMMIREYPKEKRAYVWLGFRYFYIEDYNQAIKEFEKALELDPHYGLAASMIANSYKKMGDFEKALAYFKKYESLSPGDADPFASLGDLYYRMGMLDKAIGKFKEALDVKSDFWGAYISLAYIYAINEKYLEALDHIEQLINIAEGPTNKIYAYLWRGFYYSWIGMTDQAYRDLNIAMTQDTLTGTNYQKFIAERLMAVHYYHTGRLSLSRKYHYRAFTSYLDQYPEKIGYAGFYKNLYLGLVDLKENRIDSVRSRIGEMRLLMTEEDFSTQPEMMRSYELFRAELMLAADSADKAIEIYKNLSVLEMPPFWAYRFINYNLPPHEDLLARAYFRKGDIDQAISEYERLTAFDPHGSDRRLVRPEYHYALARLYEEKGMPEKAIGRYERFLQICQDADTNYPALTDTKKRLTALKGIAVK